MIAHRLAAAALAAALLLAPRPSRPAAPPAPEKVTSVEGITEYRLANGLRVLLFPDPAKPTVTVNVTYLVGSRHEGYGETGMAHLLEHLMFKGTPRHPEHPAGAHRARRRLQRHHLAATAPTTSRPSRPRDDEPRLRRSTLEADRMVNSSDRARRTWTPR